MPNTRQNDINPNVWIGLTFPLGRNEGVGFFNQSKTLQEQAKSNLQNLLLTIPGERVSQPEFGASLHHVLFEQMDSDLKSSIEESINEAVEMWLPYINITSVDVTFDTANPNLANVAIEFSTTLTPDAFDELTLNFEGGNL
jgi:phage baseplate assembly protein W